MTTKTELVLEITESSIELSMAQKVHAFAHFSGHVQLLEFYAHPATTVYAVGTQPVYLIDRRIYLDGEYALKELTEIRDWINQFKQERTKAA